MIKILEKLNNLDDLDDEDTTNESDKDEFNESILDELEKLDLDELTTEDFESILGAKHLKKIEEIISNGLDRGSLIDLGLIGEAKSDKDLGQLRPWFTQYRPSELILNEEIPEFVPKYDENSVPDIKKLTSKSPSDFLWNNLLEIVIIYSFLYQQFSTSDFKSNSIVKSEILPIFFELCSTFNGRVINSAVEAIESATSAIFFNSTDHDMKLILEYSGTLLSSPKIILIMLSDIRGWLLIEKKKIQALRKVEFLMAWFKQESEDSKVFVEKILMTMTDIVNSYEFEEKYTRTK